MAHDDPIILFAEDNPDEAFLFMTALEIARVLNPVMHVPDGQEAIDYLIAAGSSSDRRAHPWPAVLVTDLKMPGVSGFDLLAWIQGNVSPCSFRRVVLTASPNPADKDKALHLGADTYWLKPTELKDLVRLVRKLHDTCLVNSACA